MSEDEGERKLAAILSADVAGYSRLMQDDERATVATLTEYRQVFADHIVPRKGRVVDMPGDNLLAEFPSPVEAVTAAVEIQKALAERNAALAEHRRMRFRIGINLGDILERDGRLYGDGVNVAARLEALAEPGGVLVSQTVQMQVEGKIDVGLTATGSHRLKNIARPIQAFRVDGVGGDAPPPPQEQEAVPGIAVLPFDNMSQDPEQQYFSDGIAEDIITELARLPGLMVIARNSSFAYRGKSIDVREVCRDLGIRYVLEGSVRKAGQRVRVSAQLIDGKTGGHLWAERFDRDLTDIFAVQDEVTSEIVSALALKLPAAQRRHTKGTDNAEAYDFYLRARSYPLTHDGPAQGRAMLEQAIALDPEFARAHALLAELHLVPIEHGVESVETHLGPARAAADRAMALDPDSSTAHYVLARCHYFAGALDRFEAEAREALRLGPSSANLIANIGRLFSNSLGKYKEGAELTRRAMRLNPHYPPWYRWGLVGHAVYTGDFAAAIEQLELIDLPELWRELWLAVAYCELGNDKAARRHRDRLLESSPGYTLDWPRRDLQLHETYVACFREAHPKLGLPLGAEI